MEGTAFKSISIWIANLWRWKTRGKPNRNGWILLPWTVFQLEIMKLENHSPLSIFLHPLLVERYHIHFVSLTEKHISQHKVSVSFTQPLNRPTSHLLLLLQLMLVNRMRKRHLRFEYCENSKRCTNWQCTLHYTQLTVTHPPLGAAYNDWCVSK